MAILTERIINGKKIIEFAPSPKMQLFAYAMACDPRYVHQDPEWVLGEIGLAKHLLTKWHDEFNPFFEEWLEGVILTFRGNNVKKMLEFIGLQKAFEGDFQYWKAFALREKVIQPDQINHGVIPATLGVYADWNSEQVEQHCTTLLDALRGGNEIDPALDAAYSVAEQGGSPVAPETTGGRPEVHPRRTPPLPKEPLALPESLGTDGERAQYEPEPF